MTGEKSVHEERPSCLVMFMVAVAGRDEWHQADDVYMFYQGDQVLIPRPDEYVRIDSGQYVPADRYQVATVSYSYREENILIEVFLYR